MGKICIGFGIKEGKCTNPRGTGLHPQQKKCYWCDECERVIDHGRERNRMALSAAALMFVLNPLW